MENDVLKALETLEVGNPYASFLNNSTLSNVDSWISTGSYVLDAIISGKIRNGGIPKGRLTLFYGESQTYKSSIIQRILANAQKDGLIPVIFDSENAIDAQGAERFGLDTTKVKLVPIFNIEQCRNSIFKFLTTVKEKGLDGKFIIAIDSLGNLQSAMETTRMEKDSTSTDMGTRARAIKSLLQTCTQLSAITKTTIVITNHLYDNPGEMHPTLIKTPVGGKSVIYLPSVSVQLMRKPIKEDVIKSDDSGLAALQKSYVGILIRALTAKNRFIRQFLEGEIYISFEKGADKYHGLLDLAVGLGIIVNNGSTYTFGGEKIGFAKNFIRDKDFWENKVIPLIDEKIKTEWAYSGTTKEVEVVVDDDDEDSTSKE